MAKPDSRTGLQKSQSTSLRLTRDQILWLCLGLGPVVWGHDEAIAYGGPYETLYRWRPELRPPEGEFDQGFMDIVRDLFGKLKHWSGLSSKTHRLRADVWQLSVLAFAARFAGKRVRHGHVSCPTAGSPKSILRCLQRKLERSRKRAARASKIADSALYKLSQNRWHRFQTWMRNEAAYCRCGRPALCSVRRRQQMYVDLVLKLATRIVQEEGFLFPGTKELRKLARVALRYARRERFGATSKDLILATDAARFVLERFLWDRLRPNLSEVVPLPERIPDYEPY